MMELEDINRVILLYIDYYNKHEDGEWTEQTTYGPVSRFSTK